jgi:hypothetical protein
MQSLSYFSEACDRLNLNLNLLQGKLMSGTSSKSALTYWKRAVAILKDLVFVSQTLRKNTILNPLLRVIPE